LVKNRETLRKTSKNFQKLYGKRGDFGQNFQKHLLKGQNFQENFQKLYGDGIKIPSPFLCA